MTELVLGRQYVGSSMGMSPEETLSQLQEVMQSLGNPGPHMGGDDTGLKFKPFYVYDDAGTSRFFSPPTGDEDPTDLLAAPGGALTGTSGYTEYTFGSGTSTGFSQVYPLLIRGTVTAVGPGRTCTIGTISVLSQITVIAPTGTPTEPTLGATETVAYTYGSAGSAATKPIVSVDDLVYAARADQNVDGAKWQLVDGSSLPGSLESLDDYVVHSTDSRMLLVNGSDTKDSDPRWKYLTEVLESLPYYDVTLDQCIVHYESEDPRWDVVGSDEGFCEKVAACLSGIDMCSIVLACMEGNAGIREIVHEVIRETTTREIIREIIREPGFREIIREIIIGIGGGGGGQDPFDPLSIKANKLDKVITEITGITLDYGTSKAKKDCTKSDKDDTIYVKLEYKEIEDPGSLLKDNENYTPLGSGTPKAKCCDLEGEECP